MNRALCPVCGHWVSFVIQDRDTARVGSHRYLGLRCSGTGWVVRLQVEVPE